MPQFKAFLHITNLTVEGPEKQVHCGQGAFTGRIVEAETIEDEMRVAEQRALEEFSNHPDVLNAPDDPPEISVERISPAQPSDHDIGIVWYIDSDEE